MITSAIETLRTQPQSIRHLRDRGRPRPHPAPRHDRDAASRGQHEVDPRPDAYEADALALLDLIPPMEVGDDPAGEGAGELGETERAEASRELPHQPLVPG